MSSLHRQMEYSLHSEMESSLQMCFVAKHQFAPYPSIILPHVKASNMLPTYSPTYSTTYSTYSSTYSPTYMAPYMAPHQHLSHVYMPPPFLLIVYICLCVPLFRTQPTTRPTGLGGRSCHPTQNQTHHYTHRIGLGQNPTCCAAYVKYSLLNLQSTEYFTVRIFRNYKLLLKDLLLKIFYHSNALIIMSEDFNSCEVFVKIVCLLTSQIITCLSITFKVKYHFINQLM